MKKSVFIAVTVILVLVLALCFSGCGFFGDSGGVTYSYYANCNSDIYTPCTAVTAIPGQTIYAGLMAAAYLFPPQISALVSKPLQAQIAGWRMML